jgi:hypothetical protein
MPDEPTHTPKVRHTPHTRARVIQEFRRTGRVDLACASVGVDRACHYRWLKDHPDYSQAFNEARDQVNGLLEDEAVRRAYHGTAKPVSIGGQLVMMTEFSDQLLMFLLKCRNPTVFGDKWKGELGGPGGGAIPVSVIDEIVKRGSGAQ